VLERPLRILSIVLSVIVAAGFLLFSIDELNRASNAQRSQLAGYELPDPAPADERDREKRHSALREYIDDANDILLRPFAGVAPASSGRWTQRAVPTFLALVLFGFLLAFLARFMRGRG
jgi:NADH:ubiquinone oxidoreductase subunit 3 (subunit A)